MNLNARPYVIWIYLTLTVCPLPSPEPEPEPIPEPDPNPKDMFDDTYILGHLIRHDTVVGDPILDKLR